MNTKNFRFSASSFKDYLQCGLKFKFSKIEKRIAGKEKTHYRWLGRLVHASIYSSVAHFNLEGGFKSWVLDSQVPDLNPALSFFEAGWTEDITNDLVRQVVVAEAGEKPVGGFATKKVFKSLNTTDQSLLDVAWKAVAQGMVANGINIIRQLPEITQLERGIEFEVLGRKFSGYVDVLGKNKDGEVVFLDFKTSWAKPAESKVEEDFQFFLYSYALKSILGLDYYPKGYYSHLRSGQIVRFQMTPELEASMLGKMGAAFDKLEKDVFTSDKYGFLCNHCDFHYICFGEDK